MAGEAHTPEDVLDFWFGDAGRTLDEQVKDWFGGKPGTDAIITQRFAALLSRLAAGEAREWAQRGPRERLAAVIVVDQFSRNIHRGSAKAFAADPLARELVEEALANDEDQKLSLAERWFLYMPLEHSEDMGDQDRSVALFRDLANEAPADMRKTFAGAYDYAVRHAEVIRRFGRFPHRDKILGRATTPDEQAWLDKNGGF
jgi:uncharacterized protein (DUF924 family)